MADWQKHLDAIMTLAISDPAAARAEARARFDSARSASRNSEALALAQALQILLDTREWYRDIVPFIRAHSPNGLTLTGIAAAEEHLGLAESAFNSYVAALAEEGLAGDRDVLELAITGVTRIFMQRHTLWPGGGVDH